MGFDRHYGDRKQLYFCVYNLAEKVLPTAQAAQLGRLPVPPPPPRRATAAGNQRQNKAAGLVVGRHANSSSEPHREFKVRLGKKRTRSGRGRLAGTRGHEVTWWTCSCLYVNQRSKTASRWETWGAPALGEVDLAALLPAPPQGRDQLSHRTEGLEEKGHQAVSNGGKW